jgi:DNA-binding NarL/FixJ family response regulator
MTITECSYPAAADRSDLLGVAIVSSSPVVRSGLAQVLAEAPGLDVRYQVDSIAALSDQQRPPDLVVIDLYGRRGERIGAHFWALLPGGSRAVALCQPDNPPDLSVAVRGGVRAFLTRESDVDELLQAAGTARKDGLHVCAALLDHLVSPGAPGPAGRRQHLATREIETLRWVAEGLTHGQIGRRMGLTETTVSTYVKRLRTKLNAGNKAELTRRGIEMGYVTPR